ncbi:hypothetical protein ACF060_31115 [Streptomyces werraensis]|uniref:hypothetical protein n=1 Tax=Streptomyces werraensis TaxID=68284 RepID=UPI00370032E1
MSHQIIKQPDGQLAVFDTVLEAFIATDATPHELEDWYADQVADEARKRTQWLLSRLDELGAQEVYGRRAYDWSTAARLHQQHAPESPLPTFGDAQR